MHQTFWKKKKEKKDNKKRTGYVSLELAEEIILRAKGKCEVCNKNGSEIHHVLGRKVPATVENLLYTCSECHRGNDGAHDNPKGLGLKMKLSVQANYFKQGYNENEVRALMGGKIYAK